LRQIGCAELLNDLMRHIQDPTIQSEMQETMRALVNDAELTQLTQSQLMTSPIRLENEYIYKRGADESQQFGQTNLMSKYQQI
jgi:hypothetical protein